jgi:hypothetical protein
MADSDWSREEVEAIVADYFHMLTQELSGQTYSKAEHRRALQEKLRNRSEGSVGRKHSNISAVLVELGCPYISGYKPLANYQQLLFEVIEARLVGDRAFDQSALAATELPAATPLQADLSVVVADAPKLVAGIEEKRDTRLRQRGARTGVVRDYLAREARNRSLGSAGEAFIVAYERYRLHSSGASRLSDRVEHVAATKGDGLGFDVLSFELDGAERFIEVKTTAFGRETPFFVSRGELRFSQEAGDQFHLYRLFEFRRSPRFFDLQGSVQANCILDPVSYLARFS